MTEPWGWPPGVVAELTDYQVLEIRWHQAEKVRAAQADGQPGPGPAPALPPDLPPPNPSARGAVWEYLVHQCGKTPAEADEITRTQG